MPYPIDGKIYIECRRCSRKIKGKEEKRGEKIVLVFDCYHCGNHWEKDRVYLQGLIDDRKKAQAQIWQCQKPQRRERPSRRPKDGPKEMALECLRSAMPGGMRYGSATKDERLQRAREYAAQAGVSLEEIAAENNIDISII